VRVVEPPVALGYAVHFDPVPAQIIDSLAPGVRTSRMTLKWLHEMTTADAERLIPLPDEFTFEKGAAFPLQGMTAHYLIHEFRRPVPGAQI
jgi:NADPH:quinone reductase-like Zn-dependent oxidoreductase